MENIYDRLYKAKKDLEKVSDSRDCVVVPNKYLDYFLNTLHKLSDYKYGDTQEGFDIYVEELLNEGKIVTL